jgi:hypothetical protein
LPTRAHGLFAGLVAAWLAFDGCWVTCCAGWLGDVVPVLVMTVLLP